jgi:glycosyltransferase involved in cell wall biosynthesis
MPKVSVITCTYNRAHLIGETIQSVLSQTIQDFEYIIIDDGSTDKTREVIESFRDSRILYFSLAHSHGHLSVLRNYAHQKSKGQYIAYVDSDDVWEKNKLELQVKVLDAHSAVGFSFTDVEIFRGQEVLRKNIYPQRGTFTGSVFESMLWNKLIICHTSLVIRKACIEQVGPMDESMHSGDHDYAMFLSRHFEAFVIYQPLVRVRKHDQNSTGSVSLSLKLMHEHHRTLKKLATQKLISKEEYTKSYEITSYAFGMQMLAVNSHNNSRHFFLEVLKSQPLHAKALVRWIQTYLRR